VIPRGTTQGPISQQGISTQRKTLIQRDRRHFLRNVLAILVFSVAALALFQIRRPSTESGETHVSSTTGVQVTTSTFSQVQGGSLLANASNIPLNESMSSNDPTLGSILLIHLDNGQFVAYSPVCTHAGCEVYFDPIAKNITCPCHGSTFGPYKNALVTLGPAGTHWRRSQFNMIRPRPTSTGLERLEESIREKRFGGRFDSLGSRGWSHERATA
jgi:Rieske Fe-S protein